LLLLGSANLILAACSNGGSLRVDARLDRPVISATEDGTRTTSTLTYVLSGPARINVSIAAPDGRRFPVRTAEPRPAGDYHLVLDGTYPLNDDRGERRVLPDGTYQVTVEAEGPAGERAASVSEVLVQGFDTIPARLDHVAVAPTTISPNFDDVDDQIIVTFVLSFSVQDQAGRRVDGGTLGPRSAGEHHAMWSGVISGRPVPDGSYRYTLLARDAAGNTTASVTPITVAGSGIPRAKILRADFSPHQLLLGGYVQVSMRIKNVGDITVRSQGPEPGYAYTSYETFGSIAEGEFIDRVGRWRAGADLSDGQPSEGNGLWLPGANRPGTSATPGARYPYRWGFGRDLAPGDEIEVTGEIQLWHRIPSLVLYAGLIQEGVRFHDDGVGRAFVNVTL
jgi:hypothetical protein